MSGAGGGNHDLDSQGPGTGPTCACGVQRPVSCLRFTSALPSARLGGIVNWNTLEILGTAVWCKIKTDLSRGGVMIETQHPTHTGPHAGTEGSSSRISRLPTLMISLGVVMRHEFTDGAPQRRLADEDHANVAPSPWRSAPSIRSSQSARADTKYCVPARLGSAATRGLEALGSTADVRRPHQVPGASARSSGRQPPMARRLVARSRSAARRPSSSTG
jgi:hypothetical protein